MTINIEKEFSMGDVRFIFGETFPHVPHDSNIDWVCRPVIKGEETCPKCSLREKCHNNEHPDIFEFFKRKRKMLDDQYNKKLALEEIKKL